MKITRDKIIKTLVSGLKDNPAVYAVWLEGSLAKSKADKWADIDLWIDVDDDAVSKTFKEVERLLSEIAPLDANVNMHHRHQHIEQKFYHLKSTSEFLVIDLNIQLHSRKFHFTKGIDDKELKVLFDKKKVIVIKNLNKKKFVQDNNKLVKLLTKYFYGYRLAVKKQIASDKFLDAFIYYNKWVIEPLVGLLRIVHCPTKADYHLKDAYKDLPKKITKQLETLVEVRDLKDIKRKIKLADSLFDETLRKFAKK